MINTLGFLFILATPERIVLDELKSGAEIVCLPIESREASRITNSDEAVLLQKLNVARTVRKTNSVFFQYDSDWMIRSFPGFENYRRNTAFLQELNKIFNRPAYVLLKEKMLSGATCNSNEFEKADWERVVDALPNLPDGWNESMKQGTVPISTVSQNRLMFRDQNGKLLFEVNIGQCKDTNVSVKELLKRRTDKGDLNRCPAELTNLIDPIKKFEVPNDIITIDVVKAISLISAQLTKPVFIDSRLKNASIIVGAKKGQITFRRLAEAMAQTFDLYWRKVGREWILAVSEGDIYKESLKRIQRKLAYSLLGLDKLSASFGDDIDILGESSLGDLDSSQKLALADLIKNCGTDKNRADFNDALQNGLINEKSMLSFSNGIMFNITHKNVEFGIAITK
jgi:hypothetical protein